MDDKLSNEIGNLIGYYNNLYDYEKSIINYFQKTNIKTNMKTNERTKSQILDKIVDKLDEIYHHLDTDQLLDLEKRLDELESNLHFNFDEYEINIGKHFYFEISGRRSGKTTRLVKKLIDAVKSDQQPCIVAPNQRMCEWIKEEFYRTFGYFLYAHYYRKRPIYTTFDRVREDTLGYKIDLYLFEEFDYGFNDFKSLTQGLRINPFEHYWVTTPSKVYNLSQLTELKEYNWGKLTMMEFFLILYLRGDFEIRSYHSSCHDEVKQNLDVLPYHKHGFYISHE